MPAAYTIIEVELTTTNLRLLVDGVEKVTQAQTGTWSGMHRVYIGGRSDSSVYLNGDTVALLIYTEPQSAANAARVRTYLNTLKP